MTDGTGPDATSARSIAAALALHQAGRLDEAEKLYRDILAADPGHVSARHYLGVAHLQRGRADEAEQMIRAALDNRPSDAAMQANLGLALLEQRRHDEAADWLQKAVSADAGNGDAWLNLGLAQYRLGRSTSAVQAFRRALECQPDNAAPLIALARALLVDDLPSAEAAARQAVALAPDDPAAHRQLGLVLKERGLIQPACASFEQYLSLGRRPDSRVDTRLPTYSRTSAAKLRHDAEQIDYLRRLGALPSSFGAIADDYREVLARLPASVGDQVFVLPPPVAERFASHYNRLHFRRATETVAGGALNPGIDGAATERDYRARGPGITWIDGLLNADALARLRRFCLESTIWFDFDHNNGYLGAYLEEGFFCPLLLQIAEELRTALPGIFADHPLTQMWAYKYGSRLDGIDMHADFAAINVNFWLTPTAACLDQDHGGLVVWDVEAPLDQNFAQYNSSEPEAQANIVRFLDERRATPVTVPYRENRAVIFNSDLFHKTDTIRFRPGYENRRINVTMLFGRRERA